MVAHVAELRKERSERGSADAQRAHRAPDHVPAQHGHDESRAEADVDYDA